MRKFILGLFIGLLVLLAYPTVMDIADRYINGDSDKVTTSLEGEAVDAQAKFTTDVAQLIQYADSLGYKLTFGEAHRTRYQQRHNIVIGVSQTYNSNHLRRKAVDFNLFIDSLYKSDKESYRDLGDYWETLDPRNVWGGRYKSFSDPYHFEQRVSEDDASRYRGR
jgi:hypothetical protein